MDTTSSNFGVDEIQQWIGIYGGTFDPIHFGHLRPALDVKLALNLESVLFVPCFQPVHRAQPTVSSQQRCDMIQLAIANQPGFVLDAREIVRQGPSYTVDTLHSIRQDYPQAGLVFMLGVDAFQHFLNWHRYEEILTLTNLAVMHRPGERLPTQGPLAEMIRSRLVPKLTQYSGQFVEVNVTQLDLSATYLRELLNQGQSIDYLMPESVIDYIHNHQLYRQGNGMELTPAKQIVMKSLEDGKAKDVRVLDVEGVSNFTDCMIVATGTSTTHVRALAGMVEKSFKDTGEPPLGVESSNDPEWALIDLGNVIVHIMTEKARAYYSIEKLWAVKDGTESNPVEKDVAQS